MLVSLDISNILLIDNLQLEFKPGLNVLTGETGAGKSILLDCLGFVLGWRGQADLVRKGASQGVVTASFDIGSDHPAQDFLLQAGLEKCTELIIRRINTKDGKKTAFVNDKRCSAVLVRDLGSCLVEIHGQYDTGGLLDKTTHLRLLDRLAGIQNAEIAGYWRDLSEKTRRLAEHQAAMVKAETDREYLNFIFTELCSLDPQIGEDEALDSQRRLMQSADRVRIDIMRAAQTLGQEGAEGQLTDALNWLNPVAPATQGKLDEALEALSRVLAELNSVQTDVANCLDALTFSQNEMDAVEERLFAIRALGRKHGMPPDELPELKDKLHDQIASMDLAAGDITQLKSELQAAQNDYDLCAKKLHNIRQKTATELDQAMGKELVPLKLDRAVFTTLLQATTPGAQGRDSAIFQAATNPGAQAGELGKIASGGELSRFLLALKVCLTSKTPGLTLIFDEIDRGVGGATADAVGRRLRDLAQNGQVLVVTHSAQVAALGDHQWRVSKTSSAHETISTVDQLSRSERVAEIARMISGDVITDEARLAAEMLLKN